MIGGIGLDHRSAGGGASACSSHYLSQQSKGALVGAVIVVVKGIVGRQYAYQRNVGEIVSLGHHLGADEDVGLARTEVFQHFIVRELRRRGVGIHTKDLGIGEAFSELLFCFLGAESHVLEGICAAFGTAAGDVFLIAAIVAGEIGGAVMLIACVTSQRHRAMGAEHYLSAKGAGEEVVVSASIDKENGLFALCKSVGNAVGQDTADGGGSAAHAVQSQITDHCFGESRAFVAPL